MIWRLQPQKKTCGRADERRAGRCPLACPVPCRPIRPRRLLESADVGRSWRQISIFVLGRWIKVGNSVAEEVFSL